MIQYIEYYIPNYVGCSVRSVLGMCWVCVVSKAFHRVTKDLVFFKDSNMKIRLINLEAKNLGISSRIIGINDNILINLCLNLCPTKCIQFFVHLSTL